VLTRAKHTAPPVAEFTQGEHIMSIQDETQFDYFFDALAQKYPGIADADGVTSNFQFMETPYDASWQNGNDAEAFALADSTSLRLDGFFVPGGSFSNAYADYVLSINPSTGADNAQFKAAAQQISNLNGAIQSKSGQAQAAYAVFAANNPGTQETYTQWLNDPMGGGTFLSQVNELIAQRSSFAATQASILAALDGPLSAAQKAVNPWAETMNISQGGQVQSVPLMTISGDLAGDIARWGGYGPNEYDFDVTITGDQTVKTPWKTTYTTTTHADCWGASASVSVDSTRIIEDSNYKLRVRAKGMNSYKITRGQWYHEDLLVPTTQLVAGSPLTNDSIFGFQGSLHLAPEEVFVMYQPTISLTMSTQLYKEEIAGNASASIDWVDLLGFRFAVDGLASLQPEGDEVTTTITFQAPATQAAQVVGVMSKVAWNGNGPSAAEVRTARLSRVAVGKPNPKPVSA
jgi:hypothetical protein